ncbi:MAG TPA: hypothetical protein PK263_00305 [bacterium]|nr:hypothetical protein [bacterium]
MDLTSQQENVLQANYQQDNQKWKVYNLIWITLLALCYAIFAITMILSAFILKGSADTSLIAQFIIIQFFSILLSVVPVAIAYIVARREFKQSISTATWVMANIIPFLFCLAAFWFAGNLEVSESFAAYFFFPFQLIPNFLGNYSLTAIFPVIYLLLAAFRPKLNRSWALIISGAAMSLVSFSVMQHLPSVVNNLQNLKVASCYLITLFTIPVLFVLAGLSDFVVKYSNPQLSTNRLLLALLSISIIILGSSYIIDIYRSKEIITVTKTTGKLDFDGPVEKIIFNRDHEVWITDSSGMEPKKVLSFPSGGNFVNDTNISPDGRYFAYVDIISQTHNSDLPSSQSLELMLKIYLVDLATSESKEATQQIVVDSLVSLDNERPRNTTWSEDGKILVSLTSDKKLAFDINGKVVDSVGLKTHDSGRQKTISPDGQYTVENRSKDFRPKYFIKNNATHKYVKLPDGFFFGRWLNDSKRIVGTAPSGQFSKNLFIADVNGNIEQITDGGNDQVMIER